MQRGKKILLVHTIFLMIVLFVLLAFMEQQEDILFSIEVLSESGVEEVNCWKNDIGEYYIFLPGYAKLETSYINLKTENPLYIDGERLYKGECCDVFALNIPYSFKYYVWGKAYCANLTFVQADNIATMFLDTETGSMDYIHGKKGNEEKGTISLYTANGNLDYKGNVESINGRGNNTWENFEKKPYSINLSEEADLLEMGLAQKWILLANADDASHMRNKIVYDFAKKIGLQYSPDSQWVELYLNNEYSGLYLLSERNEVQSNRVDIANKKSFLVSLEREDRLEAQNYNYISTEKKQALRIHYPTLISDNEKLLLKEMWQTIENAILSENDTDPITGKHLSELIDLDSWIKKYLIEEVFGNGDACYISQFFYYDGNIDEARVVAGPVWDFDHSLGNDAAWSLINPRAFYANRLYVKEGFDTPWFFYLYRKPLFYNRMIEIYQDEMLPQLLELLNSEINRYTNQISKAIKLDYIRWNFENYEVFEQVEKIKVYLLERIEFLQEVWLEDMEYFLVKADQGFGAVYAYYVVKRGSQLPELPSLEETANQTFLGWYDVDTDKPIVSKTLIYEDMEVYAKWENKTSKLVSQVGKLIPLSVIFVLGVGLLIVDICQTNRSRRI